MGLLRRLVKWVVGILVAILVVILLLLGFLNTPPGRQTLAWLAPRLTGGTVALSGISGRFPDALRASEVQLRDTQGTYATVHDLVLDWAPLQLVHERLLIDRLEASRIEAIRQPVASSSSSSGGATMPVTIRRLRVARVDVGPQLAGKAAAIALSGSGELLSLQDFSADIAADGLSEPGSYKLHANSTAARLQATLKVDEPEHGLIAGVADLPDLGAISLDASLDGPREAIATRIALAAGPLRATADGTVDLPANAADVTVSAEAPAMRPRPDIAWQSVAVDAHLHGPFTRPDAAGHVRIDSLTAAGAGISRIDADISGNAGQVRLNGEVAGLHLPEPAGDLLSNDPLRIVADARLDAADRPVHVTLSHSLLSAEATALTSAADPSAKGTLRVPDLAPFAAVEHVALQGPLGVSFQAAKQGDTTSVSADATIGITGGQPQASALVGEEGRLNVAATLRGSDVSLSRLDFHGRASSLEAHGGVAGGRVDLAWTLALSDLAAAEPTIGGQLRATGTVSGATDDLAMTTDITGNVSARGTTSGPVEVKVLANGLPNRPSGHITAQGDLINASVELEVALDKTADGFGIDIRRASWKSLQAAGSIDLPTATMVPLGNLRVTMTRLADLEPLIGRPVAGSVDAAFSSHPTADVLPLLDARINAEGMRVAGLSGANLHLTANGTTAALAAKADASLSNLNGAPARLGMEAKLDAASKTVVLAALQADWHQQTVRLLAPARIGYADGVSIDRLRLGLRQAVLELSGHAGSTLDITASLRDLPASIAAVASPALAMEGTVQADAHITGTSARPSGRARLAATGLRLNTAQARAIPAANVTATADLNGTSAQIDARVTAGDARLAVNGRAPLGTAGALDLHAAGGLNLAMLDPILAAAGRRVHGQLTLDATVTGTTAAPNVVGTAQLAGGEVQDFGNGIHLADMVARVQGNGTTLRIAQFSAKAGEGTINLAGTVGVAEPGLPVDLTLTARNAKPLASDLISAVIDADLTLRGEAQGQLAAGGEVRLQRADIQIPERMPVSVAVLPISRPGAKPPPSAPPATVALNLILRAPARVFIRGRGISAEFGGEIRLSGTTANPQSQGGFNLRRGSLSLAGRTLDFTEGRISFNGGSITDPAIHLVAASTNGNIVATLAIDGTAQNPKITLSSVPQLPQDEVLAQLLFGTSTGKLGPIEVAEIAASLATLTGAGGGAGDPLNAVRQGLGLDRLSVVNGANGNPAVEAGRYVAPRVYMGAKQSASGGSQALVQFDITKGLKLQATAGTGTGSATGATVPGESNGSSVGVTYQFQY